MAKLGLELYYDLMSQPSRALYILFNITKVPYIKKPVALRKGKKQWKILVVIIFNIKHETTKYLLLLRENFNLIWFLYIWFNLGEHLTDDFANNVNRFKKVPCIKENNLKLSESVAIVKYLSREYQIPDHWYPNNSQHRAQVDEYLEWQHLNTRLACAQLFQTLWIQPKMFGKPVDEKKLKEVQKYVETTLDAVDKIWLGQNNKFLIGNEISVADLFAATEILQTS